MFPFINTKHSYCKWWYVFFSVKNEVEATKQAALNKLLADKLLGCHLMRVVKIMGRGDQISHQGRVVAVDKLPKVFLG